MKALPWLVSVDEHGAVDGYVHASKHRERAAYQWSVDVTAYVREGARGQGVGKKTLCDGCSTSSSDSGTSRPLRALHLPNAASIALHESLGFKPLGVYRKVGYKHGAWRDVGWWQKELRPPNCQPSEPAEFSADGKR